MRKPERTTTHEYVLKYTVNAPGRMAPMQYAETRAYETYGEAERALLDKIHRLRISGYTVSSSSITKRKKKS